MGASLLAVAKSMYYNYCRNLRSLRRKDIKIPLDLADVANV